MRAGWTRRLAATAIAVIAMASSADGQPPAAPNIQGVWQRDGAGMLLVPLDGRPIPFTTKGRALYTAHRAAAAKGDYTFDETMTRCASPGQPRLMLAPAPFAIFVRPRMVTLLYQWNRMFRQIAVGNAFASPALGERWWAFGLKQGHAQAEWRADTLVVHTGSFLDGGLLDSFLPVSDQLELTEHIRLRDRNTLEDRLTITDPANFTRPWQAVLTFTRSSNSLPFAEDVCLDRLNSGQSPLPKADIKAAN